MEASCESTLWNKIFNNSISAATLCLASIRLHLWRPQLFFYERVKRVVALVLFHVFCACARVHACVF